MGIASSALPPLAHIAVQAAGPAIASTIWLRGRVSYALFLMFIIHFIVVYPFFLMNPISSPYMMMPDGITAYFLVFPLIALGFGLVGLAAFNWLRLPEMMPLNRWLGALCCKRNYGPRPTNGFIVASLITWVGAITVSHGLYGLFVYTRPVAALVVIIALPIAFYAAATIIFWRILTDPAIFGKNADEAADAALRGVLVPAAFHVATNLVLGLIVHFQQSFAWAWIAAAITAGSILIIILVVGVFMRSGWLRPPRTGLIEDEVYDGGSAHKNDGANRQVDEKSRMIPQSAESSIVFRNSRTNAVASMFSEHV